MVATRMGDYSDEVPWTPEQALDAAVEWVRAQDDPPLRCVVVLVSSQGRCVVQQRFCSGIVSSLVGDLTIAQHGLISEAVEANQ